MTIRKLVVVEFIQEEDTLLSKEGYHYSFFQDPDTLKFYRPKASFKVEGDNLEDLFEEIKGE